MQALFSMDMSGDFTAETFADHCRCFPPGKRFQSFFDHLVNGVLINKEDIDAVIEDYSSNWKMRRMACVDRNILRMAAFELLYCADIPAKVTINEAIDIGRNSVPRSPARSSMGYWTVFASPLKRESWRLFRPVREVSGLSRKRLTIFSGSTVAL